MFKRSYVVGVAIVLLLGLAIVGFWAKKPAKLPKVLDTYVEVATAVVKPMPVEWDMPGSIEALQSVDVRPQISGTIKKIDFTAGQDVTAGQLLFEIDPAPFQVSLLQAQANLVRDQAQAQASGSDEQRFAALVSKGYVSREQYEQVRATAEQQKAMVAADLEKIHEAQIQLGYTNIQAPIAGKTGDVLVKQGDLVTSANNTSTPLVTINQLNPVLVDFYLPQTRLPKLLSFQNKSPVAVQVWNDKDKKLLGSGQLVFVDNNVSSQTGTVLLKASISNSQNLLWPGLMVSVKLILTIEPHAVVIPTQAVKIDQNGNFVYRVVNGQAMVTRITANRQVGDLTVVSQGLSGGEQIVVVAPPELSDGTPVKISQANP